MCITHSPHERRIGELMAAQRDAGLLAKGTAGTGNANVTGGSQLDPPVEAPITLSEVGIDKDSKEARNVRIWEAWLRCETIDSIADTEGMAKGTVSDICSEFPDLEKLNKSKHALADHADEGFIAPLYNIWKQQTRYAGSRRIAQVFPKRQCRRFG